MTPREWKSFYKQERSCINESRVSEWIEASSPIPLSENSALIFPHTRLLGSGELVVQAARTVIESERHTILAIGVLHGLPRDESLRGIYGPGIDKDIWRDEFSLDNVLTLLPMAARLLGKQLPKVIVRYPFLSGTDPDSLRGFDELEKVVRDGALLVATADMLHHGAGYETPESEQLDLNSPEAMTYAHDRIAEQLSFLSSNTYDKFLIASQQARSDFRDAGPVVAALLGSELSYAIYELMLVNYADIFGSSQPTWVAAALAALSANN